MDTNRKSFFSEQTGKVLALIGLGGILLVATIFIFFSSWSFSKIIDESILGVFGDFIGGVIGSILALAGIILYYVALKEQRREISLSQDALKLQVEALNHQIDEFKDQKIEMQETRKIHDKQTQEFEKQTKLVRLQQFDASFYSLLNVFIELKKNINNGFNNKYFENIYLELKKVDISSKTLNDIFKIIENKYIELLYTNHTELSQYYKTVYRIFLLIEKSNLEVFEKEQYFKIFRSQLTNSELLLLFYDYHSRYGINVRPLAIKYKLFKHLPLLERIEFKFKGDIVFKSNLTYYLNIIVELLKSNFNKFIDIESTSDVCISEQKTLLDLETNISLNIDEDLELSVSFIRTEWYKQNIISKEYLNHAVSMCIYDTLFLSRYKFPENNIILVEYIESEQNNSFKLRFVINNILNI